MKAIYLLPLILVLSCSKQDEKQVCDTAIQASFNVHDKDEFWELSNKSHDKNIYCGSTYTREAPGNIPQYTTWSSRIILKEICNTDVPNIDFSVTLQTSHPSFTISGSIMEDNLYDNRKTERLARVDSINYHSNIDFNLSGDYSGSKSITAEITFVTESKGTYSADSAFFFSNLDYMSCKITAHKPE